MQAKVNGSGVTSLMAGSIAWFACHSQTAQALLALWKDFETEDCAPDREIAAEVRALSLSAEECECIRTPNVLQNR